MSLLDSFYLLFKSNAADVSKEIKDLDKATKDYHEQTNKADQQTVKFADGLDKLTSNVLRLGTAFLGFEAVKSAFDNTVKWNAQLERTSRLTNTNARDLSIWDDAVAQAGGTTGEFVGWYEKYAEQLQSAGLGGQIKNIIPDLIRLSSTFKDLNDQQAFALGQKLGIPQDLVLFLKEGPDVVRQVLSDMSAIDKTTEQTAQQAQNFERAMKQIGIEARGSASFLVPIFELLLKVVSAIGTAGNSLFGGIFSHLAVPDWLKSSLTTGNATAAASVFNPNAPLGIRSNNPGNVQPGGREAVFGSLQEGVNAEQDQLRRYGSRGVNTLGGVANLWPDQANRGTWLAAVSKYSGFDANQSLDLNNPNVLARVSNGINAAENGSQYGNLVGSNGQVNVDIGTINVNTQATDADGISRAIGNSLNKHISMTINQHDDAVDR
jgi:hypothetical protein